MSAGRPFLRRLAAAVAVAGLLCVALPALHPARAGDGLAPIPEAHGYVNDEAGVIGEARVAQLEQWLHQLDEATGVPFAVLVVNSCAPEQPDDYKTRVFQAWDIRKKGKDEGLLLLVAMEERRAVFETGYGLEGVLTDGWQAGMLRDLLVPRFRAGQYADGVTAAVLAAGQKIAASKGVEVPWTGDALRYDARARRGRTPPLFIVAFIIFIVVVNVLRFTGGGRRGRYRGGPWIGGGPTIGGWGGGFGGGGGGGSSFGGFGGGGGGFGSGGGGGGAGW